MKKEDFIGKTKEEAEEICRNNSLKCRTVRIDNERFIVTQELNPTRYNFEIENGLIVAVEMG